MKIIQFLLTQWRYVLIIVLIIILYFISAENKSLIADNSRKTKNIEVLNSNYVSYKSAYNTGLKTIKGKDSIIQLNAAKVR